MGKIRNLKDYIEHTFSDKLWAAAEEFMNNHQDYFRGEEIRDRSDVEIEIEIQSVNVKFVWATDLPDMKIHCDVGIEVVYLFIVIDETCFECSVWLLVGCEGDLDCALRDFEIKSVDEYSGQRPSGKSLDKALVPFIKKEEMDEEAVRFLETYYPEALKEVMWVDPCEVARRMGLTVRYADITADRSIFGRIFFHECETELYNVKTGETYKENIPARTILVDKEAAFRRGYDAENNTIIHECVHWEKHRKAFMLARVYDNKLSSIGCRVDGSIAESKDDSVNWMEWQANALTPRIQMPINTLKAYMNKLTEAYCTGFAACDMVDSIEFIIRELSDTFGVSKFSVKLRLLEAGFEEAAAAFTYIDGKYVRPHTVSQGYHLEQNQTFSIGAKDAAILALIDDGLRKELAKGLYQYIDGHFVLKHEKYYERDDWGNLRLTHYALRHMEECCLIFELSVKGDYGIRYNSACFLNRDKYSLITFDYNFHQGYEYVSKEKQEELLEGFVLEVRELLKSMPKDYAASLRMAIDWRNEQRRREAEKRPNGKFEKITAEGIAKTASIHEATVRRTLKGEKTSLNTLILICLTLHLPPEISDHIIKYSPYSLVPFSNDDHFWYHFVLHHCNGWPVAKIREFLENHGAKPL